MNVNPLDDAEEAIFDAFSEGPSEPVHVAIAAYGDVVRSIERKRLVKSIPPMTMSEEDDAYLRQSPRVVAGACVVEIDALRAALAMRDSAIAARNETIQRLRDDHVAVALLPEADALEKTQQIAQLRAERLKLSVLLGQLVECVGGFRKAGLAHGWKMSEIDSLVEEANEAIHG